MKLKNYHYYLIGAVTFVVWVGTVVSVCEVAVSFSQ
jgi:nitric oxide reductase large subunit